MADEITDRISPSVIRQEKLPLCRPSPPLFLLLLPHLNSPLPNYKQPALAPQKKKFPLLSTSHVSLSFVVTASVF